MPEEVLKCSRRSVFGLATMNRLAQRQASTAKIRAAILLLPQLETISTNGSLSDTIRRMRALRDIRVGPAGWSYADWRGRVYPEGAGTKFDTLSLVARYFDTVEINSSF